MTPTVLLFDIDGTLLSSSGAGRRAMERALFEHTGMRELCRFVFDGMTDPVIVRTALALAGRNDASRAVVDAVLDTYVGCLRDELGRPGDYHLYPGVAAALDRTRGLPGVAVGLGTGNIRRGADLKLGRAGIERYFAFGGFGCDDEDRGVILRTGAARGAALLGRDVADCRVVVIGDTPRDVAAAMAIGAECVAVGTGRFGPDELRAAGAHAAFADLTAEGAIEAVLNGVLG